MAAYTEQRTPRTLVLCFDGTANEFDADNTSVVKLFALLKKDTDEQLLFYQAGVGTWFKPGVVSPIFEWGAKVLDLALAWYLDAHVMDGYTYLMQNYCAGDKICIFGFSRGAYTARALGGLLHKVGLLHKDNEAQVPFAYKMYKRTDTEGERLSAEFKRTYCQTVCIEFMGVWDTVSSVGVVMGRTLPFADSNNSIKTFRQALSLDEHRARYWPNYFHRSSPSMQAARLDPEHGSHSKDDSDSSSSSEESAAEQKKKRWGFLRKAEEAVTARRMGKSTAPELSNIIESDVLEVWFPGCHTDVGGGAVSNETEHCLANISLRWMVREAAKSGCIQFDPAALAHAQIELGDPTPAELEMDDTDALQTIHDQLKLNPLWWLLEIIPLHYSWQDADGVWHREWNFHLGRGRKIVDPQPKFHTTVRHRMLALTYTPKAEWNAGTEVYIH